MHGKLCFEIHQDGTESRSKIPGTPSLAAATEIIADKLRLGENKLDTVGSFHESLNGYLH